MKLVISDQALKWFQEEMGIKKGDSVRFYVRYGGSSPVQNAFSLGISVQDKPNQIGVCEERDGILFYVEDDELWYFHDHHLFVDLDDHRDIAFRYVKG